jgi:hypothetical protein
MKEAGYQQQSPDSSERLEEKIDKLAAEFIKLRLIVEKLSVGQINFHLANLNIHEVSGALNIGITNGVNLQSTTAEQGQEIFEHRTPDIKKEFVHEKLNKSGPGCKIHYA